MHDQRRYAHPAYERSSAAIESMWAWRGAGNIAAYDSWTPLLDFLLQ